MQLMELPDELLALVVECLSQTAGDPDDAAENSCQSAASAAPLRLTCKRLDNVVRGATTHLTLQTCDSSNVARLARAFPGSCAVLQRAEH